MSILRPARADASPPESSARALIAQAESCGRLAGAVARFLREGASSAADEMSKEEAGAREAFLKARRAGGPESRACAAALASFARRIFRAARSAARWRGVVPLKVMRAVKDLEAAAGEVAAAAKNRVGRDRLRRLSRAQALAARGEVHCGLVRRESFDDTFFVRGLKDEALARDVSSAATALRRAAELWARWALAYGRESSHGD